ncbi:MAG: ABC transporter ATP-binding protein [Deltaproteobacteria bacterium]|nr:MAG: ABC transporter ATP-binding protein [Deltaproteobacteria bacterium]
MIKIKGLTKKYGTKYALRDIDLEVKEGELFAYLGPNGAGKTTTIRILTGLTRPTSGDAWLNGFHIEKESIEAKRQCGLVPQTINLDNELTVFENLNLHGILFQIPFTERKKKIFELLEYIGMLDVANTQVAKLSGGMKRRITIARALLHSPKILFLDEPTVGLDANIRRKIWALIKKIQSEGTTIFLTTHYIEEAEFLANRVAFLDKGKIVAVDSPSNLISALGQWAVDTVRDDFIETVYFRTKEEAKRYISFQDGTFSLRRVNLEDAFLHITGKKVAKTMT